MTNFPQNKELRDFGFIIGLGLPLLIGYLLPILSGHSFRIWTLWIAIPAIIFASLSPRFLLVPYRMWMMLGNILGWINSRLILGLVFILVLQPIALIMRVSGYDPLKTKINTTKKTYREEADDNNTDLTKIF